MVEESYFTQIAESYNLEPETVKVMYEEAEKVVKSLLDLKGASKTALERRAKSQLMRMLANRERAGESFDFILIGPIGRPRDWNEPIFQSNEALIRTSPRQLINEGKVFWIEKDGVKYPIKRITSYEMRNVVIDVQTGKEVDKDPSEVSNDDNRYKVVQIMDVKDGEIWDARKDLDTFPVWRDNLAVNENLKAVNWNYGKPLKHNYRMDLLAIGYPSDNDEDLRMLIITVSGDAANPNDENFLLSKLDLFTPYRGQFTLLESKTEPDHYSLRFNGAMPKKVPIEGSAKIDEIIGGIISTLTEKFPESPFLPEFYDGAAGFIEFHERNVNRDEQGNIVRSRSGWESSRWTKIAVVVGHIEAVYEPKHDGGRYMFRLRDWTSPDPITAFADDTFKYPEIGKIPGLFLMSGRTSRSPNKYDRRLRQQVVAEPGQGDINVNLYGIVSLETEAIEESLDEEGEL